MDRVRRRPEPAAIDITWVSCRGVRSSLPFHTPCLYASIYLTTSSSTPKSVHGRRPHRVKTPTDRAGGENPEWDAPLRLYVPDATSPELETEAGNKKDRDADGTGGVLLVRFELKSEVAVLGDVLAASAVVPVYDLVADGRTRRVSYQLAASDGRQPNGVISFSYAFHDRSNNDVEDDRTSDGEPVTLRCPAAASAVDLPPPPQPTAASGMYPVIDWTLTEQVSVCPLVTSDMVTVTGSRTRYHPPPPPVTPAEPVAVYPPLPESPTVGEPASGMYPTVDLAPVSCYPHTAPCHGGDCGYAAAPEWDDRCLYS